MICSTDKTGIAPAKINSFVPLEVGTSTRPGSAITVRFWSNASIAVMSEPDLFLDSITKQT